MLESAKLKKCIIVALLVSQAGLLFFLFFIKNNFFSDGKTLVRTFYEGPAFYDTLFEQATKFEILDSKAVVGIVPHHLMVGDRTAAFFLGLANENVQTVVLVSPDHFGLKKDAIVISGVDWQTPYGILKNDYKMSEQIAQTGQFALLDSNDIGNEHGVGNITPFIKKVFPKAKMVAVMLKDGARREDLDKLVRAIISGSNSKNILVLASVDFVHDLPAVEADKLDEINMQVINELNFDNYKKITADRPEAIYTVLKYASLKKCTHARLIWHTNSSRLLKKPNEPGVSHLFYFFD